MVKRALLHHHLSPIHPFLRRLKDQLDSSGPLVPVAGKQCGGAQPDGDVPIMATGMHYARRTRCIFHLVRLLDGQCIHIEAQHNGRARVRTLQQPDHARLGDPCVNTVPRPRQVFRHET